MEIKNHLVYLKRSLPFILIFAVVVAVVTYIIASRRPASYQVVQSYEVTLVNRTATPDYQYGSYYDLKGAELFTQHVMSMLRNPALIGEIYAGAGTGYVLDNLNRFTSQFRTEQDSSQQFTVHFSRYNEAEAEALAQAMSIVLEREVAAAQTDQGGKSMFGLVAYTPVIVYAEVNALLLASLGLVSGVLCAIVLVYLNRYLHN